MKKAEELEGWRQNNMAARHPNIRHSGLEYQIFLRPNTTKMAAGYKCICGSGIKL